MYCGKCGREVLKSAKFCPTCGERIQSVRARDLSLIQFVLFSCGIILMLLSWSSLAFSWLRWIPIVAFLVLTSIYGLRAYRKKEINASVLYIIFAICGAVGSLLVNAVFGIGYFLSCFFTLRTLLCILISICCPLAIFIINCILKAESKGTV